MSERLNSVSQGLNLVQTEVKDNTITYTRTHASIYFLSSKFRCPNVSVVNELIFLFSSLDFISYYSVLLFLRRHIYYYRSKITWNFIYHPYLRL